MKQLQLESLSVARVVIPGRLGGNLLVMLTELSTALRGVGRGSGRGLDWSRRRGSSVDSALILLCYYGFVHFGLRLRR